ncbi:hypothetical protein NDI37_11485 [Funiculus sociatus GB2-A5]|uniref:Beta-ketoacyl synthase N-terminal domain-containing protein n=1 Tax=Funiculus sociatus GB2-A5 TaxID=2933946 RepID=A0ABV0JNR1_9CYAN|nr:MULTISPECIES: hypothetical protein [unclassified Trichocoleus]MBD1908568.1 hypothetical protein [Trichocoleus sp. FACHB-832]MBD2063900.1 hypothetical protein [Trichocoleus sp. FACHB-6]
MSLELKQVVVTGLGAITLVGNPVKEYWKKLPGGYSSIGLITLTDAIPPTINLNLKNPYSSGDIDYLPQLCPTQRVEVFLCNSFSFAVHNVTLAL